tara:strand:- start:59 stop:247 length:189 start_codon:yes stop_codon:yes gene_type:complete
MHVKLINPIVKANTQNAISFKGPAKEIIDWVVPVIVKNPINIEITEIERNLKSNFFNITFIF